jgi:uncharacterized damage-inducible protein DinB
MKKNYRPGALGALIDEYERAAEELAALVEGMSDADFPIVRDRQTTDEHCRSVQTILSHVVHSGHGYANQIRKALGMVFREHEFALVSRTDCPGLLRGMMNYTAETFQDRWHYGDEEITSVRMVAPWGPQYDLEQLLEHAIVHILRHRRQVERFLSPSP